MQTSQMERSQISGLGIKERLVRRFVLDQQQMYICSQHSCWLNSPNVDTVPDKDAPLYPSTANNWVGV